MNSGGGEVRIGPFYVYCLPLFFASGVVYVGKAFAIIKRIIAYACYTVGNYNARKACTITERIIAYACYTVTDYHAR